MSLESFSCRGLVVIIIGVEVKEKRDECGKEMVGVGAEKRRERGIVFNIDLGYGNNMIGKYVNRL